MKTENPDFLSRAQFNAAVTAGIEAVRAKLETLESTLSTDDQRSAAKSLRDELVVQAGVADELGDTGSAHVDAFTTP